MEQAHISESLDLESSQIKHQVKAQGCNRGTHRVQLWDSRVRQWDSQGCKSGTLWTNQQVSQHVKIGLDTTTYLSDVQILLNWQ